MRQGKKGFRHESLQDSASIRKILKALITGLEKGKVTFSDEEDEIVMEPRGLLHLKLSATQDENRRRINIRVTWQEEERVKSKKSLSVS